MASSAIASKTAKAAGFIDGPISLMDNDKFHLTGKHYFLTHSIGAQPKTYDARIAKSYTEPWRHAGAGAWESWLDAVSQFQTGLAPLIGAEPQDICPQTNVSGALTKILYSLPARTRRTKIVLTEDDFPTVGFVLAQARRLGYELVFLPGGERLADPDAWAPAFQDDVQLVLATQVYSNSSVLAPVEEIARRARARGVFSIIDVAQSAGAVPLKLNDWRPDFAVGTCLKYLCSGPGAAFLWALRDTAERCAPMDVGWFSHEQPFAFDIHNFNYAKGAGRYLGGTPSIAPFAGAGAAFDILAKHGVDAIYAHNQKLLSRLFEALPRRAVLSSTGQGSRGSGALIKVQDYEPAVAALARAGIIHDTRLDAVRISIHLYNEKGDIDALVETLSPYL